MIAEMKKSADSTKNTKEKILDEALTLFAKTGFKGTSVKNIADAVGIKDSSLYKHYNSKQEILDTIVYNIKLRMENLAVRIGLPTEGDMKKAAEYYGELTLPMLVEIGQKTFLFYLEDEYISRFWRLANMEQYQNPEIYEIFHQIFMEESIEYQSALFKEMIRLNFFIDVDSDVIAMSFYTPIFFLLSKYNGREEKKDEALQILEKQIAEFYRIYRK